MGNAGVPGRFVPVDGLDDIGTVLAELRPAEHDPKPPQRQLVQLDRLGHNGEPFFTEIEFNLVELGLHSGQVVD